MIKDVFRAFRFPFISASILPYIAGSLLKKGGFDPVAFSLGALIVLCTHLSANLINDYADAKSGVDYFDRTFYGFFGGSKLIQEKVFSEKFYLSAALLFAIFSLICVAALCFLLKRPEIVPYYFLILFLGWAYSARPARLSYRRLGEPVIFLLFGPATVMGGYFIQAGVFPDTKSFLLSLPFGFFTAAILFANEIPDFREDEKGGKLTWVGFLGQEKSYLIYILFIFCGLASVFLNISSGNLSFFSISCTVMLFPAFFAAGTLKKYPLEKKMLVRSSKATISIQALTGLILILDLLWLRS
ncbi:MAG: prenyltransferase [Candidatus Omnitrophica bacterium]|nr:prenyltransferase [Candidatus Omnitrophota bacterium]